MIRDFLMLIGVFAGLFVVFSIVLLVSIWWTHKW